MKLEGDRFEIACAVVASGLRYATGHRDRRQPQTTDGHGVRFQRCLAREGTPGAGHARARAVTLSEFRAQAVTAGRRRVSDTVTLGLPAGRGPVHRAALGVVARPCSSRGRKYKAQQQRPTRRKVKASRGVDARVSSLDTRAALYTSRVELRLESREYSYSIVYAVSCMTRK